MIVHPDGPLSDAIAGLEALGGVVRLEYDNFDFVAATVPSSVRDELESSSRIALVEDDSRVEAVGSGTSDTGRRSRSDLLEWLLR